MSDSCYIDPNHSRSALDKHHVYPLHLGGAKDGPLIPLCKNCHREVHAASEKIMAGKASIDDYSSQPKDFQKLVIAILKQADVFRQTDIAPDARRRMAFELTKAEHKAAHYLKVSLGFTSLETMMRSIIMTYAKKMGFNEKDYQDE